LLRKLLYRLSEKINLNQYPIWKYGEKSSILVGCVDPLTKNAKMCGVRNILKEIFILYALREQKEPNEALLN
jgi:hypothetical protein